MNSETTAAALHASVNQASILATVRTAIAYEEQLTEPFHRGRVQALRWVLELFEDRENGKKNSTLTVPISGTTRARLESIRAEISDASGEATTLEYATSIALILGTRMLAGTSQRAQDDRQ